VAGKPEHFLKNLFWDYAQAFSHDGRWLAYTSNELGKFEVYVRSRQDHEGNFFDELRRRVPLQGAASK
jgi:hypothetical protein